MVAILTLVFAIGIAFSASRAQTRPDSASSPPEFTVHKMVDEVEVPFTVTDEQGRLVQNLTARDFTLFDDGIPVERIAAFRHQPNVPLRVGILIDCSDSVRRRFRLARQSASELVKKLMNVADEGFAAAFSDRVILPTALSAQADDVLAAIEQMRASGGETALYAMLAQAGELLASEPKGGPTRHVLVIFTDGEDNLSRRPLSDVILTARRAQITIYPISIRPRRNSSGQSVLREIAAASGGRVWFPSNDSELQDALNEICYELRAQYLIAYRPPGLVPDGRFHAIRIATNERRVQVHARAGYYAPIAYQPGTRNPLGRKSRIESLLRHLGSPSE